MFTSERSLSMAEEHCIRLSQPTWANDASEYPFFQDQLFQDQSLCRDGDDYQAKAETTIDWRRFREAGLLDESLAAKKHRDDLLDRESKLQCELIKYQHNMGLLLLEKEECDKRFKKLNEDIEEARAILKREKVKNLIEFSESQQREEYLRNSLTTTKQSIINYQRVLRDLQGEYAQVKNESENLVLNSKYVSNGDKLVDKTSSVSLELYDKLRDLENHERVVKVEQAAFRAMRDDHEVKLRRRREELKEMEKRQRERMEELAQLLRN